MPETKSPLYLALMGTQRSLDDVLNEASQRIAEIGRSHTTVVRRAVRRDGVSETKLYDLKQGQHKVSG